MMRLAFLLYSIIGTTLAGSAMVVALTIGWLTIPAIVGAAALGFVVAAPVAWAVAKAITSRTAASR